MLDTSAGMLSGQMALLSLSLRMAFRCHQKMVHHQVVELSAVLIDHTERLNRWHGPCLAGFVGAQPILQGSYAYC